ncbi:hypothetical protein B0H15DRAFT_861016 [Mycena belliarum]|uniref:SMP-30/Gluconolactonase/LRE-like region domain-containing protein n=1 Tax=Mycena belliarum TaxID=1033014 RepID=A0AAD6XLA0_9AGAR|nr:hypothetical protein B0H15DRAFT_861016 [Mycena belliae]
MLLLHILSLLATALPALATFPTKLLYQSPTEFFENIAVRPNGKLLITAVTSPTLFTIDPAASNATLDAVYTFPNGTGMNGIAEYAPNVYAVVVSKLNDTTRTAELGSVTVWRIALTTRHPVVKRMAVLPDSKLLNGLSPVPGVPHLVLGADTYGGIVYEFNMRTGATRIALQTPVIIGINGLHVRHGALYLTNSLAKTLMRVPLTMNGSAVTFSGPFEVLGGIQSTAPVASFDDFTVDTAGRAWVATLPGALTLFTPHANGTWSQENAAGDPAGGKSVFAQPTSAAFGRKGKKDGRNLYVVTHGGQLVRVDTGCEE